MKLPRNKIRPLACCSLLSVLVHLSAFAAVRVLGHYDFGLPVNQPLAVLVDLAQVAADQPRLSREIAAAEPAPPEEAGTATPQAGPDIPQAGPEPPAAVAEKAAQPSPAQPETAQAPASPPGESPREPVAVPPPAQAPPPRPVAPPRPDPLLKTVGDFLGGRYEKLTYQVTMHGVPVAGAELESKNENGVTVISLRMKSNAMISGFYPVDNEIETRHIDGRFIMTRIRQHEGSFSNDESFTINLRKKSVSWVDARTPHPVTLRVPSDGVLDTLSGIYYLRNRPLQVGRNETLPIFDSETFAEVPVEVLRREELRLPNLTSVATLVVRPLQKTAGVFRRTGELLIWLTDDACKVPVKIVTSIPLGRVTAELVSAETKAPSEDASL